MEKLESEEVGLGKEEFGLRWRRRKEVVGMTESEKQERR